MARLSSDTRHSNRRMDRYYIEPITPSKVYLAQLPSLLPHQLAPPDQAIPQLAAIGEVGVEQHAQHFRCDPRAHGIDRGVNDLVAMHDLPAAGPELGVWDELD